MDKKPKIAVHMIGNAHIDLAWIWPWQDAVQEALSTCRSAVERLEEFPNLVFTHGEACTYEWIEKFDPELFTEIKKYVRQGRWCIVNGWWCQPDLNISSGESLVRQALYGKKYFRSKFGVDVRVGYNIDSFGHPGSLPQLLKKSGFNFYVLRRPSRFEMDYPSQLFQWENVLDNEGDCGSKIDTFRITDVYSTEPSDDIYKFIRTSAEDINRDIPITMCFFGVGNHGGGPTRKEIKKIIRLSDSETEYNIVFSSPARFHSALKNKKTNLPNVKRSLQYHAVGCYSVVAEIKKYNRMCENILNEAEKWSTLAFLMSLIPYPGKLIEHNWKRLLFNQFHDIAAGSSIPSVCNDAIFQAGGILTDAEEIRNTALRKISRQITGSKYVPGKKPDYKGLSVIIFNSLSVPRHEIVELEPWFGWEANTGGDIAFTELNGNPVKAQEIQAKSPKPEMRRFIFKADVPSMGFRVYQIHLKTPRQKRKPRNNSKISVSSQHIENQFYSIKFNKKTGAIKQLFNKKTHNVINSGPFAIPIVIEDKSDTWGHEVNSFNKNPLMFTKPRFTVLENGPLRVCLQVEMFLRNSKITQKFSLCDNSAVISSTVKVDWGEKHKVLKFAFPCALNKTYGVAEIPYGHEKVPTNGNEFTGQRWVGIGGTRPNAHKKNYNIILVNDSKYGYDITENCLRLTVLRSPGFAHESVKQRPFPLKPDKVYEYTDQGIHEFTYQLIAPSGKLDTSKACQLASKLNNPMILLQESLYKRQIKDVVSYIRVEPASVSLETIKKAETSNATILRFMETSGKKTNAVIDVNILNFKTSLTFNPGEIKTVCIKKVAGKITISEVNLLERKMAHVASSI